MKTKVEIKFETKNFEASVKEACASLEILNITLRNIDRRSIFEKVIDLVSDKLFGGKSCMPNELKSFR